MPEPPRELRLVITAADYESALHLYRDVLGMREEAAFTDDNGGRAVILHAGRATVEIGDEAHAEAIDELEVGRRSAPPLRIALEVADAEAAATAAVEAGAVVVAAPVRTPWGSLNARLDTPDGQQLTLYSQERYLAERPRLDGPVTLAATDPAWAQQAEALASDIRTALGEAARLVEHVGSTAVPDLPAKPVLDLVLGVDDPADEEAYVPALTRLGYQLYVREPEWHEHRLLRRSEPAVNLHVFAQGSSEVARMIAFRDRLRTDAADHDLYRRTKAGLAARHWEYVQDYADAKADVVEDILRRAQPG